MLLFISYDNFFVGPFRTERSEAVNFALTSYSGIHMTDQSPAAAVSTAAEQPKTKPQASDPLSDIISVEEPENALPSVKLENLPQPLQDGCCQSRLDQP